jgi:rhodanese-related sulfurtransferase
LKIAVSAVLLALALVGTLTSSSPAVNAYIDVDVSQAKQMIDSNPDLVILDVRTQSEYDSGHIQNATFIPVSELAGRLGELDKNKEILVYCASGGRSATASQTLVDNGFSKVYNMLGGITAWISAGYWIEIIRNGDLLIDGTQTFVIENCTYMQTGNIFIRDYSTLVIKDAEVIINQTGHNRFQIATGQHGKWYSTDANFSSNHFVDNYFSDDSVVNFTRTRWKTITHLWANGAVLTIADSSSIDPGYIPPYVLDIDVSTVLYFRNSSARNIDSSDGSSARIENSLLCSAMIAIKNSELSVSNLNSSGHIELFNTFDNLTVSGGSVANLTITNSHFSGGLVHSSGLVFACTHSNILFENIVVLGAGILADSTATIHDALVHEYLAISESCATVDSSDVGYVQLVKGNATISNSAVCLGYLAGDGFISIVNSTIKSVPVGVYRFRGFRGTIYFDRTSVMRFNTGTATDSGVFDSDFVILGDVSFSSSKCFVNIWTNSSATRNFSVATTSRAGPIDNVSLSLCSSNNTQIWYGNTDNLGHADFNVTFADENYTDMLRLEAVKGNLTAIQNVTFLSDTPILVTMHQLLQGDINQDFIVDLYDAIILAGAYNSSPSNPNWNSSADLNSDNVVDIYDAITLANNFGKTA